MPEQRIGQIASVLAQRRRLALLAAGAQVVLGAALTFAGPGVLATMFWAAARLGLERDVPWTWLFGGLAVLMVPLLVRLELRTAGRYLSGALAPGARPVTLTGRLPGLYVGMAGLAWVPVLANPGGVVAGVVEVFLTGPRVLLNGVRAWSWRRWVGGVDLRRAAEIVGVLAGRSGGLEIRALCRGGEQPAGVQPTLVWLALDGWIGVAEREPKVYLYTRARELLRESGCLRCD